MQELSSHVVTIDSLCDILEHSPDLTDAAQKTRLLAQVARGMGYVAMLQDKTKDLGLGDGAVVHESRQTDLTTGNTVKAAMIFARTSRLLKETEPVVAKDYLAPAWKQCLRDFAYGYFLPACRTSPFLILPDGYYRGVGLQHVSSWYHGQSNMYSMAALLALESEKLFEDPDFHDLAVANVQWVSGLNSGWSKEEGDPWLSYSFVECSDHYARSMASYGIYLAACGFENPRPGDAGRCGSFDCRGSSRRADGALHAVASRPQNDAPPGARCGLI